MLPPFVKQESCYFRTRCFWLFPEPSFPYRSHHSKWDKLFLCNPGGVVPIPVRPFLFQILLTSTIDPREGISSCPDTKHLAWCCRWKTKKKETWSPSNLQSSRTTLVTMMFNQFLQNSGIQQQIFIVSPFLWVRIRIQLPGYLCLKIFSKVAVKLSAGAAVSSESSAEGNSLPHSLTWTLIPCHMDLSTWQLVFSRARDPGGSKRQCLGQKPKCFLSASIRVTSQHFWHILFIRRESINPEIIQRYEY